VVSRLAYLGPPGTFSEEAALSYAPQAQRIPFPSIPAVAQAVQAHIAEEGIVPIENSLEGAVNDTLDLLIHDSLLRIRGELVLPIEHCLLAPAGTQLDTLRAIYSHPQALGQCRGFLERHFPKAAIIAALSTAAAVEEMKRSVVGLGRIGPVGPAAAIAPLRAAELYGVEVLARAIQDRPNNVTRFVVLAPTDHAPTGRDKTSLCFSFAHDRPGLLYGVMGEFARRHINLAKIESRPTKEALGRYIFLADLEGHREDAPVKEALEAVQRQVSLLKVFGSYPRWTGATRQERP
jgi:prephenate dehydratase